MSSASGNGVAGAERDSTGTPVDNKPDLFERIAQALPHEQRQDYWREITYLKHLQPEDELLRLTRATGYLTQITQGVPRLIAEERQRFEKLLTESVAAIERAHKATQTYHRELDQRLSKLPEEIAQGIQAEVIAKRMSESFRQQIEQTGLQDTGRLLTTSVQELKEVSRELDHTIQPLHDRYGGIGDTLEAEVRKLHSASGQLRQETADLLAQTREQHWAWKAAVSLVLLVAGVLLGSVWEKNTTASLIVNLQQQVQQLQQTIKALLPPPTPQGTKKKRT
jgi:hypothetical protein